MSRTLAMSQFLGHQTRSGSTSQFLRGWRKRHPAAVNFVLHTKAPIVALWQHGLPRIYEQKDEKTGSVTRRVFSGSFNCIEDESVLLKQYRRDRNTGERILPPVVCPVCLLLEHLRGLYDDGQIGFTDVLFRWEGDIPEETQTLSYGGMLNLYGNDHLTDEEKTAMRQAGVKPSEAWRENSWAKCNYVFVGVDADEPEAGVQIAIETTALGDAVKECIHSQLTSLGDHDGNPMLNPYAIRFEHHKSAKEFNKKYKAIAMPRVPVTDQIMELITGDPPDLENVIRPGNVTKLRAELEARCVLKNKNLIPWDDIFGPAERAGFGTPGTNEDEEAEEAAKEAEKATASMTATRKKEAQAAVPAGGGRRRKKDPEPEPEPEPASDVEMIPCDECGAPMPADATTCPKCGAEYELDDEPTEQASPPAKGGKKIPF